MLAMLPLSHFPKSWSRSQSRPKTKPFEPQIGHRLTPISSGFWRVQGRGDVFGEPSGSKKGDVLSGGKNLRFTFVALSWSEPQSSARTPGNGSSETSRHRGISLPLTAYRLPLTAQLSALSSSPSTLPKKRKPHPGRKRQVSSTRRDQVGTAGSRRRPVNKAWRWSA